MISSARAIIEWLIQLVELYFVLLFPIFTGYRPSYSSNSYILVHNARENDRITCVITSFTASLGPYVPISPYILLKVKEYTFDSFYFTTYDWK